MRGNPPTQTLLKMSELSLKRVHRFELTPDDTERDTLATALGIRGLRKLRFTGELRPLGKRDWHLEATLGATVTQDCVVTLTPVNTRIDEDVIRSYLAELPENTEGGEEEMPDDDTIEALPDTLDLSELMSEALALALPPYPRAEDARLGSISFTEPGKKAMTDEDTKPFAGLAGLKAKLEGDT